MRKLVLFANLGTFCQTIIAVYNTTVCLVSELIVFLYKLNQSFYY